MIVSESAPRRFTTIVAAWVAGSVVAFQTGIFLAQVMVVAGILLAGLGLARGWVPRPRGNVLLVTLAAGFVWLLLAAVASPQPADSLGFVVNKFALPALALLGAWLLGALPGATKWVFRAAVIGGVFSALNGIVQYFFGVDFIYGQPIEHMPGGIVPFYLPVGLLNMALTFAGMQLLLLLFLLPWAWTRRGRDAAGAWTGLGTILLSIVLAFRRGPWLGVLGLGGLFLITRNRRVALVTIVGGATLLVGLFVGSAAFRTRVLDTVNLNTASEQDRVLLWQAAAGMGRDNLLTGIGPGQWRDTVPGYVDMEREWDSLAHPHSDPFWLFAVGGIPALLFGFAVVAVVLARGWRALTPATLRRPSISTFVRGGATLAAAGLVVAGLFQCYLLDGETMIAVGFLLGLAEGVDPRNGER